MSYYDYYISYTKSGLPSDYIGTSDEDYESDEQEESHRLKNAEKAENKEEKRKKEQKNNVIRLVAGYKNTEQIQNKIIKIIFNDGLDCMINRYMRKEFLSYEYVDIAKQSNGLLILLKGFLKNVCGYTLTQDFINEINCFVENVYININLDIAYKRVGRIQQFIHEKMDRKNGINAHLNLPVKQIRDLLSTSRLHLNIHDIKNKDAFSLLYMINRSKQESDFEKANPSHVSLPKGKKYIKNWKVRHMMSLAYFLLPSDRIKIKEIMELDINLQRSKYITAIVDIYMSEKS